MRGAPASSVAKIPGWPSVGTLVTCSKPASRSNVHGQFAAFVHAAIFRGDGGCWIHCCKRWTDSSWRFSISVRMASMSSAARTERVRFGNESAAAPTKTGWLRRPGGRCGDRRRSEDSDSFVRTTRILGRRKFSVRHGSPGARMKFGARIPLAARGTARGYTGEKASATVESWK